MGILLPRYHVPVTKTQLDRCKCGHAMFMHAATCTVASCKCRRFTFPTK